MTLCFNEHYLEHGEFGGPGRAGSVLIPHRFQRKYGYSFQKNPGATFIPSPTSIPEYLPECLEEPYVMDLNKKASQNEGKRKYSTV